MSFDNLFNPHALLLVVGGTLVATLLRSGWGEIADVFRMIAALFRRRFSEARIRGALAGQVQHINAQGLLRAQIVAIDDADLSDAVSMMFQRRTIEALGEHHEARRIERERIAEDAVRLLNLAADLAPVFGLAGTLVALTQLPVGGLAPEAISGVVSSAVLTTLYGVLSANFVYAPLARQIARVSAKEEQDRTAVVNWLSAQITVAPFGPPVSAPSASRIARIKTA